MKETPFNSNSIYEVLYICDSRDTDHHKLFHVKCKKCGYENDVRKFTIDHTEKCHHVDCTGYPVQIIKGASSAQKRLYDIFGSMKVRCYNRNDKSYRFYGGRGIKICEEWLNDKNSFVNWALDNGYEEGLTIDRINSDKDYCPENCRWVTLNDNARYKSSTSILTVNGETHTGKEWARILNIGVNVINRMLRRYGKNITIQFIIARQNDMSLKLPNSNISWLDVYNIPHQK